MPKRKTSHSHHDEIEHIKEDLDSLRNNVVALSKTVQNEVADEASERMDRIKSRGRETMKTVEKDIKARPLQSLATAFGAGVILSMLVRRH